MRNFTQNMLLLLVLILLPEAIQASEIKSVTLSVVTEEAEEIPVSQQSWGDMQEIKEELSTFLLKGYTATTEGDISSVSMYAAIYKVGNTPKDDNWSPAIEASKTGDNTWSFMDEKGHNLLGDLTKGESYILEFYFVGSDGSNTFYYKNGEQNFKVKFKVGSDDNWTLRLQETDNASMVKMTFNGKQISASYDNYFNRTITGNSEELNADISSATLDYWYFKVESKESLTNAKVSLQYKVYEQGTEGMWNTVLKTTTSITAAGIFYYTYESGNNLNINLLKGTEPDKTYVLEVMYQIIFNDNYYMFGKGYPGCKFTFKTAKDTGITDVKASTANQGPLYNLQGVKVGKDYHGIVIQNGKKWIMK